MKYLKLFFLAVLPLILCMFQCDGKISYDDCYGAFYVRNCTDVNVGISYDSGCSDPDIYNIESGDSVCIYNVYTLRYAGYPDFGSFLKPDDGEQESDKSVVVMKDGKAARMWLISEMDFPGRQFFDESLWRHYVRYDGNMPENFIWTFDILPEDLETGHAAADSMP